MLALNTSHLVLNDRSNARVVEWQTRQTYDKFFHGFFWKLPDSMKTQKPKQVLNVNAFLAGIVDASGNFNKWHKKWHKGKMIKQRRKIPVNSTIMTAF